MTRRVLIDTGPLVALRNLRDQHRIRIEELARGLPEQLLTCWPVLTEAAYLLRRHPQEVHVLLNAVASGILIPLSLGPADANPIAAILAKYQDQGISLADATLMHLAERDGINEIFTIDAKDFMLFRKADGSALTLIN